MMAGVLNNINPECNPKSTLNRTFTRGEKFCPSVFDQLLCWPETKAGTIASQPCPVFADFHINIKANATRQCEENGQWFFHKEYKNEWTNYSLCWNFFDPETALVEIDRKVENSTLFLEWYCTIKTITHIGFGISLTTLIVSMIIFLSIRRLQCARNRLHMHLFASFILRGFMSLLKDGLFTAGVAFASDLVIVNGKPQYIKEHNFWLCKAITSAWFYSIIANYMLILMEGMYLHNLMFAKTFLDNSSITIYCLLGWGLPCFFTITWIILRIYSDDILCWTIYDSNKYYYLLLDVPVAATILINFVLFITIIYVLIVKVNTMYIQQRRERYKRLLRSTLILIPLFGVPYILSLIVSFFRSVDERIEVIWILCDQTFSSLEGFFVALIYCLLNNEVGMAVKQRYKDVKHRLLFRIRRERIISHTSIPLTLSTNEYSIYEAMFKMHHPRWDKSSESRF